MAYYSRTPRTTYRKSYRKTYRKRSTVAKPKTAVSKLYRKVRQIQRQIVPITQNKLYYQLTGNSLIGNAAGNSLFTVNLSKCADWSRVWATDADDEQSHCFVQSKMRLGGQINTNGERALVNTTLFVVSLTKTGMAELWNTAVGTLNTMALGVHFTHAASTNGLAVYLNPRYFRVHWLKRIYTGSPGGLATDTYDLNAHIVTGKQIGRAHV